MAIISASLDTTATTYKSSYGFSGNQATIDNAAGYKFSIVRPLTASGYDQAYLHLRYVGAGTTDGLEIHTLSGFSNASVDFDDRAIFSFNASKTTASRDISFVISDVPYYRIGFRAEGSTDDLGAWLRERRRKWKSA